MKRSTKLDVQLNSALKVSPQTYAKELKLHGGKDHAKKVSNNIFVSLIALKNDPTVQRSYNFWKEVFNIIKKES